MKITCPSCNAVGNIPEHSIPDEGRFLSCPRCKHGFTVQKPRAGSDEYIVDTCPACAYSTFGEERFSTCPQCDIQIKTYVDRQREEQTRVREQELLAKKYTPEAAQAAPEPETSTVAAFVDNLHPVKLMGWGCAAAAGLIFLIGVWGLLGYHPSEIQAKLAAEWDEPVSGWYVFFHFGLMPWIKTLYGVTALVASYLFIQQRQISLPFLTWVFRVTMGFIPLYEIAGFIGWVREPIPHSFLGYFIELVNLLFMTALWVVPLFFLHRFLEDKRVTSVVTQ